MINTIIFLLISLVYNLYVIIKHKTIPVSLSETSYMLGGFWFTGYCFATVFLILPILLEIVPQTLTFLPFLMCSGLMFAGASPMFKKGLDKPVHYISSIISFIGFIIFVIFIMGWYWLIAFVILLAGLCIWKKECYVYFAEMLVFLFIVLFIL